MIAVKKDKIKCKIVKSKISFINYNLINIKHKFLANKKKKKKKKKERDQSFLVKPVKTLAGQVKIVAAQMDIKKNNITAYFEPSVVFLVWRVECNMYMYFVFKSCCTEKLVWTGHLSDGP